MLPLTGDVATHLKRARIVLLAAAAEHPVDRQGSWGAAADCQPLAASLCRPWFEGLQDKPRPGKQPIYTKATDSGF